EGAVHVDIFTAKLQGDVGDAGAALFHHPAGHLVGVDDGDAVLPQIVRDGGLARSGLACQSYNHIVHLLPVNLAFFSAPIPAPPAARDRPRRGSDGCTLPVPRPPCPGSGHTLPSLPAHPAAAAPQTGAVPGRPHLPPG